MKLLRDYVRLIVENAIENTNNLALLRFQFDNSRFVSYVLYDSEILISNLNENLKEHQIDSIVAKSIVGYMQVKLRTGECNNAAQVKASVAKKGYGPMLYDLVMCDNPNGLMPDRAGTSTSAKRVWQYYEKIDQT